MPTTLDRRSSKGERQSRHDTPPWVEPAGRAGWVARGVVYALIAVLVWEIPSAGREDVTGTGALERLAQEPFGGAVLVALVVGLGAFSVWRGAELFVGSGPTEWYDKAAHVASALAYGALAVAAAALVLTGTSNGGAGGTGDGTSGRGADSTQQATSTVFDWPGGRWMVAVAGLVLVAVGVYKIHLGLTRRFTEELDGSRMSSISRSWVQGIGMVGVTARGLVFLVAGWFLAQSAVTYQAQRAKGLDQALGSLANDTVGDVLFPAIAVGLASYALYCLAEARYREIPQD